MAKIKFRDNLRLGNKNKERLIIINRIIEEYASEGYKLTLRQLYYQLVSRDIIPNIQSEYAKLSTLLVKGRMAGVVDWEAIEDRIRIPYLPYWVVDIEDAINDTIEQYRLYRQLYQKVYIEVWVEKDALSGVLKPVTSYYHINLMVNRGYCVAPDTLVLTADLRWVKASDISIGMELVGVDENPPTYRKHRKIRLTKVKSVNNFVTERVKVFTDYGEIIVSLNHPFLVTRMTRDGKNWHGYRWIEAGQLHKGWRIARLVSPWNELDDKRKVGWLAGMYDGEGCLPRTKVAREITLYQKPGIVLEKARSVLKDFGFNYSDFERPQSGTKGRTASLRLYSFDNILRLLGQVRPIRLLEEFKNSLLHSRWAAKGRSPATVLDVVPFSSGKVVGIETTTKTLITEGLVSHNSSCTAMHDAYLRLMRKYNQGKKLIILYFGDHDPSGLDMIRDVESRLKEFDIYPNVKHIALTSEQIEIYNPPPNPAKISDPRAEWYINKYGDDSWEVDALNPKILNKLVTTNIEKLIDLNLFNNQLKKEKEDKKTLSELMNKIKE